LIVKDADEIYARATSAGAKIVESIEASGCIFANHPLEHAGVLKSKFRSSNGYRSPSFLMRWVTLRAVSSPRAKQPRKHDSSKDVQFVDAAVQRLSRRLRLKQSPEYA